MRSSDRGGKLAAFRAAFPHTIPILTGFGFLGMAYGVLMHAMGFSFLYPMIMSLTIFGGSLEFVVATMLLAPFAPVEAFVMALLIQARHLFYGIAMLERYKGLGRKRGYLIYGLCDETFSINCTAQIPEGVDRGWFYFFVTLLNQFYWVAGATVGGLLGSLLSFDFQGLDFVMTAMFAVFFLEQLLKEKTPWPALIGVGSSVACLLAFGPESFLIPAMACILLLLGLLKTPLEKGGAPA